MNSGSRCTNVSVERTLSQVRNQPEPEFPPLQYSRCLVLEYFWKTAVCLLVVSTLTLLLLYTLPRSYLDSHVQQCWRVLLFTVEILACPHHISYFRVSSNAGAPYLSPRRSKWKASKARGSTETASTARALKEGGAHERGPRGVVPNTPLPTRWQTGVTMLRSRPNLPNKSRTLDAPQSEAKPPPGMEARRMLRWLGERVSSSHTTDSAVPRCVPCLKVDLECSKGWSRKARA